MMTDYIINKTLFTKRDGLQSSEVAPDLLAIASAHLQAVLTA